MICQAVKKISREGNDIFYSGLCFVIQAVPKILARSAMRVLAPDQPRILGHMRSRFLCRSNGEEGANSGCE